MAIVDIEKSQNPRSKRAPIEIGDRSGPIDVSLVVSSIGRPTELRRLVDSLAVEIESGVRIELIVVDQSEGEVTPTLETLLSRKLGFPCIYARSSIGVSHGRNVGLGLARGDYVMFPDDDAWFSGTMLRKAVDHLSHNDATDGFCARLCAADGSNSMLRWSPKAQLVTHRNHHRTSIGSVMLFRRTLALEVDGFDEAMGPGAGGWLGSCEDADFLLRTIEHGGSIWYDPEAVVHHRDSRNDGGDDAEQKSLAYGCGQGHMWRSRDISRLWVLFLIIRRLTGSVLMDLRGRRQVGRVQRAWIRGTINGLIGQAPLELAEREEPQLPSDISPNEKEFSKSFRWRIAMSGAGILATFILTALAARGLPDTELALFYVLLASLSIGPILSRLGINTKAVQELGAARARGEWDVAVRMARQASVACLAPTLIFGPLIAVFVLAWSSGSKLVLYGFLASVILIVESVRLTYSDIFIGLGMPRWGATLAHQARAVGVTALVLFDTVLLGSSLSLDRLLVWTAIVGTGLALIGHVRLWSISYRRRSSQPGLSLKATVRAGIPFLMVDLVAVLIARGDVWLATKAFDESAAAIYSTASVVAMQIFTPIGLANVALAPVAAGYLALGRSADLQRVIQRTMSALALILLPLVVVIMFAGDWMLSVAYGARFSAAHPYLNILLVGNTAFVTLGMSSVVLVMAGRQRLATLMSLSWLALAGPLAISAALYGGPRDLAIASSLATVGLVVGLAVAAWVTTGVKVYPTPQALVGLVRSVKSRASSGGGDQALVPSIQVARPPNKTAKRVARRSPWWLWPAAPVILLAIPAALASLAISEDRYIRAWRTQKNLDFATTTLMLSGLGALLAGLMLVSFGRRARWASSSNPWGKLSEPTVDQFEKAFKYLVGFSLLGYSSWLANGFVRGGLRIADFVTLIKTQDNEALGLKSKLPNIPPLTTLTQVAIVAVIVGVLIDINRPSAKVRWMYRSLLLLAFARAFLLSERLAIVEMVVPLALLRAANWAQRGTKNQQLGVAAAPMLSVIAVLLMFGAAEYSRSWNYYSDARDQPFAEFVTERLVGYYATSFNNGALLIKEDLRTNEAPFHTVTFLWEAPAEQVGEAFPIGIRGSDVVADAEARKSSLLKRKGNPEFNSPSGIAAPFIDYGYIGGAIFFVLIGIIVGTLHLSFASGRLWGLLTYPVVFVGVLELPRYVYWVQGRATPAFLAAILVVFFAARRATSELRAAPRVPDPPMRAIPVADDEVVLLPV